MTSEWRQWEEALRADVEPWEHERAQDALLWELDQSG